MKIIYEDGGILTCSDIEVCGGHLLADGIYEVPVSEVERIEED